MQLKLNGNEVFYANGGVAFEAAKPTVVFLHGAGMDHTVWTLYSLLRAERPQRSRL